MTGANFITNTNPGSFPTFPPLQAKSQIAQINATHQNQLWLWREQEIETRAIKIN